jgi:hypothetical protein
VCSEKHWFNNCYYLIPDSRPSNWKPDPKIVKIIENKIKGSKPLRQAIEWAIKQANQKADGGQSNQIN